MGGQGEEMPTPALLGCQCPHLTLGPNAKREINSEKGSDLAKVTWQMEWACWLSQGMGDAGWGPSWWDGFLTTSHKDQGVGGKDTQNLITLPTKAPTLSLHAFGNGELTTQVQARPSRGLATETQGALPTLGLHLARKPRARLCSRMILRRRERKRRWTKKPRRQRCSVRAARLRTWSRMPSSSWCKCSFRKSWGQQASAEAESPGHCLGPPSRGVPEDRGQASPGSEGGWLSLERWGRQDGG